MDDTQKKDEFVASESDVYNSERADSEHSKKLEWNMEISSTAWESDNLILNYFKTLFSIKEEIPNCKNFYLISQVTNTKTIVSIYNL